GLGHLRRHAFVARRLSPGTSASGRRRDPDGSMLEGGDMPTIGTIIVVTTEDDRFKDARRTAVERARAERATLVLYDIDAGGDPLESPLPTGWSAEGTDRQVGDRLGPDELEAAGRGPVARQVLEARRQGVDA